MPLLNLQHTQPACRSRTFSLQLFETHMIRLAFLSPSFYPAPSKFKQSSTQLTPLSDRNHIVKRVPIAIIEQQSNKKPKLYDKPDFKPASPDNSPPYKSAFPPGKLPFALELDFFLNHPVTDGIIAILVALNCLSFALQTIDVGPELHQLFQSYESNLSILFLVEYFGRWYGKGLSPAFLLTRGMILDFIAVSPIGFAVADQSEALFVRILRLSRILRIQRVVMDTDGGKEMMDSMNSLQVRLASIGLSLFSLLYVSAGLFYQVEKDVNPAVLNFFDAFYFSTVTLFTVGFGDVTPLTSLGKIITVLTVLTGAVIVPYQLSEVEQVRKLTSDKDTSEQVEQSNPNGDRLLPTSFPMYDVETECKRCFLRGHQVDARFCRNCGALLLKRRFD